MRTAAAGLHARLGPPAAPAEFLDVSAGVYANAGAADINLDGAESDTRFDARIERLAVLVERALRSLGSGRD